MNYSLVTGASGGIGEGIARKLAEQKQNLILIARSKDKLESLAKDLRDKFSVTVQIFPIDLGKEYSAEKTFQFCQENGYVVDCLINNAGVGILKSLGETEASEMRNMLELNVTSLTQLTLLFANQMVQAKLRGTILNVASTAAFQPIPYMAAYAATKSYVLSFSQAVDFEYSEFGIRVLALCPGTTATNFFQTANFDISKYRKFSQSTDEVVAVAMQMIQSGDRVRVSGWKNALMAKISGLTPNSIVLKIGAKFMGR